MDSQIINQETKAEGFVLILNIAKNKNVGTLIR